MAVRRAGIAHRVTAWGGTKSLKQAIQSGVVDGIESSFDEGEVSEADLVYLSAPIGGILDFLQTRGWLIKPGAIVTDAGSTKREICRIALQNLPPTVHFVGGHPMAGSHQAGVEFARPDLFEGAPYAVIPNGRAERATLAVVEIANAIGARPVMIEAEQHDRIVARTSHAPQLLSTALAVVAAKSVEKDTPCIAGRGFADMTRLAESPWSIWKDICRTNADEIAVALGEVLAEIDMARRALAAGDDSHLQRAFEAANKLSALGEPEEGGAQSSPPSSNVRKRQP